MAGRRGALRRRLGLAALLAAGLGWPAWGQDRVTILNDAFGKKPGLELDWGYSALVEFEGKRILFDTGDNAALFQRNVEALHVDLGRLDMVVISHAHGDHTAGLRHVLAKNPRVPVYVADDPYFTGHEIPAAFLTTGTASPLPGEMRYFGGKAPPQAKDWLAFSDVRMTVVTGPMTLGPHIRLVSAVAETGTYRGVHEIALVLDTAKGAVVMVGCSHPKVEAFLAAAMAGRTEQPVYRLFGGLHLVESTKEQIAATLTVLADQYHVQRMAVGHCTGEPAFLMIRERWGKQYDYAGLGEVIGL